MNRIAQPSRAKSTGHSWAADPMLPNPLEIEELARVAWLQEGARPGLEHQYRHEVAFQLQLTRHLLASELSDPFDDRPAAALPA